MYICAIKCVMSTHKTHCDCILKIPLHWVRLMLGFSCHHWTGHPCLVITDRTRSPWSSPSLPVFRPISKQVLGVRIGHWNSTVRTGQVRGRTLSQAILLHFSSESHPQSGSRGRETVGKLVVITPTSYKALMENICMQRQKSFGAT